MSIVVYSREAGAPALVKTLETTFPSMNIESFSSAALLAERVRHKSYDIAIALFHIRDESDMDELISYRQILGDLTVVALMVQSDGPARSRVHSFYPRYVETADEDYERLMTVIGRLVDRGRTRRRGVA